MTPPVADAERDRLQQLCWERAIHAFGTAGVFEKRARKYRRLVRVPAFLGIVVPLVVGGMVLSFGTAAPDLAVIIGVAGVLGITQLVISAWALVAGWESSLAYSLESATENHRLAAQFERLAQNPPKDLQVRFDVLDSAYQARCDSDVRNIVSPPEKRYGLRVGLQRFQRECVECHIIPTPEKPTECPVCGP